MLGGNCVEDEVEAGEMLLHGLRVGGNDNFVNAQTLGVGDLLRRCAEQHHTRAESLGKFHAHVSEAAKAHNAYLLTLADIPMA